MTLDRGPVGPRSTTWIAWSARAGLVALLLSCVSPPSRPRAGSKDAGDDETGGASGEGGTGTGGRAGSGGRGGRGGAGGTGGADETGGEGGSSGAGGKMDASVSTRADSGPATPDAVAKLDVKLDGKKDTGPTAAKAWEQLNLVLANCVFCHNDPAKRLDLQESGLHARLVNANAERVPAGCANKVLVVPNNPMASLLYQKLTGNIPADCGERMPYKKAAVTELELNWVADWINAGAPPPP